MENKKIKNATPLAYNGIQFKSKLEKTVYKTLSEHGFSVMYEPVRFVLWEGFKPTVPFYDIDKTTRLLRLKNTKLIDITYTPDFMFTHNGHTVIVEAKGMENDVFYIKKKLFREYLEKYVPDSLYFEVRTKRQLLQVIDIIKAL